MAIMSLYFPDDASIEHIMDMYTYKERDIFFFK